MWKEYNPNPKNKRVEDCVVRAMAKALDTDWNKAYLMIVSQGLSMCDMPHSNAVWGAVLKREGFKRLAVPNTCPDCYTAKNFCEDHPEGTFVLGFGQHVATVIDGILYDSWNSSDEIPQYYWYRRY